MPSTKTVAPIKNSHHAIGSNKTNKIPVPIPIKHTPIVFFNASNIIYYLLLHIILKVTIKCEYYFFYIDKDLFLYIYVV